MTQNKINYRLRNIERFILSVTLLLLSLNSIFNANTVAEKYGEYGLSFVAIIFVFSTTFSVVYLMNIWIIFIEDFSSQLGDFIEKNKRWLKYVFFIIVAIIVLTILYFILLYSDVDWQNIFENVIAGVIILILGYSIKTYFHNKNKNDSYETKIINLYTPLNDILQNSTFFHRGKYIDMHGISPEKESSYEIKDIIPFLYLTSNDLEKPLHQFVEILKEKKLPTNMDFNDFQELKEKISKLVENDIEKLENKGKKPFQFTLKDF